IEERAVILGIAIDTADKGAEKEEANASHMPGEFPSTNEEMIRLTAQIAVPGRIPLGPGDSSGTTGSGAAQQTIWALDVTGHTIDDAVSNLQQQISAPISFGHLRIIVLSEEMARRGLQNLNDYLRRNAEVRRMTWMVVARGNAAELMRA